MTAMVKSENAQHALWNGEAGEAWVEAQALLDRMFQPFEEMLVEAAMVQPAARILDVGCGTGAVTRAAARRLGPEGRCTGVDISQPMIAAARARAARDGVAADFIRADAQTHPFAPESFDVILSRFGVMFFEDPVRAFANLRRGAARGGLLTFAAWRSADENPFMTTAERAAAPLLPDMPARQKDAPGQFAFGDPARIAAILEDSGWRDVAITPVDAACAMPRAALDGYITRLGPLGRVLHGADEVTRARVIETVRTAFAPFVEGQDVRFTAACWMVAARAS